MLKSKLLHEQLKCGNYSYKFFDGKLSLVLQEYKIHKSITKAAIKIGLNPNVVMKWFIEGQKGNPNFEVFYLGVARINNLNSEKVVLAENEDSEIVDKKDYTLESIGGSWVYTTFVDDEKVSIISSDLNHLKEKISNKNLPLPN